MDKKVLFQAILWSVAAYLLFQLIVVRVYGPPQKPPPADQATTQPTTQPVAAPGALSTQPETPSLAPSRPDQAATQTSAATSGSLSATGAGEEESFVLGSVGGGRQSGYRAELTLSNVGASVESVLLSDYKAAVDADDPYRLLRPVETGDQQLRSLSLESILLDGVKLRLDELLWRGRKEEGVDSQAVVFECDVVRDQKPIIHLTRRYVLKLATADSARYDLKTELTVQNLSDQRHEVRLTQRGAVGIQKEDRRTDDRRVNVGLFLDGAVQPRGATQFADVSKNTGPLTLFDAQGDGAQSTGQFWWVAAENKYFAFITTPVKLDGSEAPGYVHEASAVDLDGAAETPDDVAPQLVLGPFSLQPGDATTLHVEHYIGPKDKRVFLDDRNADYRRRNYYLLNQDQGLWCTFSWLTGLMVTLLNSFYAVVRNYGVAIFLLVLVVRVILHPITKKTQVNMVKMQQSMGKLQPKLEEVKKRCANDKQRLQQETMRVYKEAGVNPAGQMLSCLPMMLQMPIWVALYSSLNNNIAMRHHGFIWWINDLTAPDQLYKFAGSGFSLPLVGAITALNLLPLFVGATMYAQQKLMPKSTPPASSQSGQAAQMQKQMQTMMPLMSVFMVLIFYNMPSGLNLYIMTSSVLGALEQWHIRKHVEAEKERIADTPFAAAPGERHTPKKPRGPSVWERLAKKADEAQKLRSRRK